MRCSEDVSWSGRVSKSGPHTWHPNRREGRTTVWMSNKAAAGISSTAFWLHICKVLRHADQMEGRSLGITWWLENRLLIHRPRNLGPVSVGKLFTWLSVSPLWKIRILMTSPLAWQRVGWHSWCPVFKHDEGDYTLEGGESLMFTVRWAKHGAPGTGGGLHDTGDHEQYHAILLMKTITMFLKLPNPQGRKKQASTTKASWSNPSRCSRFLHCCYIMILPWNSTGKAWPTIAVPALFTTLYCNQRTAIPVYVAQLPMRNAHTWYLFHMLAPQSHYLGMGCEIPSNETTCVLLTVQYCECCNGLNTINRPAMLALSSSSVGQPIWRMWSNSHVPWEWISKSAYLVKVWQHWWRNWLELR